MHGSYLSYLMHVCKKPHGNSEPIKILLLVKLVYIICDRPEKTGLIYM